MGLRIFLIDSNTVLFEYTNSSGEKVNKIHSLISLIYISLSMIIVIAEFTALAWIPISARSKSNGPLIQNDKQGGFDGIIYWVTKNTGFVLVGVAISVFFLVMYAIILYAPSTKQHR